MNGEKGILFTQGNEACVRGALYAGLRFFAGYPITPSTEVAELLSEELPHVGGRSQMGCLLYTSDAADD